MESPPGDNENGNGIPAYNNGTINGNGNGNNNCPMLLGASVGNTPATPLNAFNPALALADAPPSPFVGTPMATPMTTAIANNGTNPYHNSYLGAVSGALMGAYPRPQLSLAEQCLESFYQSFFPGHPAVLPKTELLKMSKKRNLEHLLAAMRWAGSQYIDVGTSRAALFDEAIRLIYDPDVVRDGFLVQAMVIMLVALDGCAENERARDMLSEVEGIAIQIRLYTRGYAAMHGENNPQLEESWRRAWWDLFVVSGSKCDFGRSFFFFLFLQNALLYDRTFHVDIDC